MGELVFAEWYGSKPLLEVSRALMGCKREDMQLGTSVYLLALAYCAVQSKLTTSVTVVDVWVACGRTELFNLLVNPVEKDYALSWHRDDVKATASEEEEAEKLKIKHHGVQWNVALYDDGQPQSLKFTIDPDLPRPVVLTLSYPLLPYIS